MRWRWKRKTTSAPEAATPEPAAALPLRTVTCRFCGPVEITDGELHLQSPEHRRAQAEALAPQLFTEPGDTDADQ